MLVVITTNRLVVLLEEEEIDCIYTLNLVKALD